jgi:D-amino-acid dehydrogenase
MKSDVVIVGGGIVGLSSAYALAKSGKSVTVIDRGEIKDSASFGNAGLFSPFEKNPLSYPGVVASTIKLMLMGKSPVILHPSLEIKQYKWLWNFIMSADKKRLMRTLALFEMYGEKSKEIYKQIIAESGCDFDFCDDGLILVYTEQDSYNQKISSVDSKDKYKILDFDELKSYIPMVSDKVIGGVLLKRNAYMNPDKVMEGLKEHLKSLDVEFVLNEEIVDINTKDEKIYEVVGKSANYSADEFIFSTGADTEILKKCGVDLMMIPAKGYSITFNTTKDMKPKIASLFADLFIAMTPRSDSVRITSKLEIGSKCKSAEPEKIKSIINNLRAYSEPFEMNNQIHWAGFRPLPPNDMPLIGRDEKYRNLIHANGLGWLGLTFGPVIGQVIKDLIVKII